VSTDSIATLALASVPAVAGLALVAGALWIEAREAWKRRK
jgi:hypothetical protein